jgi:chemotaxis protein MotB
LKRQPIKEEKPKVPAYIVTFSDMTTLLLTFFVMLLSLSSEQDDEMFHKGRESFSYAIKTLGLGMLVGRKPKPDLGYHKVKYYMDEPNEIFVGRSINTKEEKIRKLFKELNQSMKSRPSVISAKKTDFTVTNIRFAQGDAQLDESAKQFLGGFSSQLQQNYGSRPVKLYVLGLANDQRSEKEQWILSAKRAKAAADYLRGILPSGSESQIQRSTIGGWSNWSINWWGAGPGGDWVQRDSPISKQSQILIAVLRVDD